MKKLLFIFFALPLIAADYSFLHYENNYKQARKRALDNQKLLMLVVVQEHCNWCQKLASQTLQETLIKQKIKRAFVPLLLNSDHDPIPENYHCISAPAIYFIDPLDDEEVWRAKGYKDVDAFLLLIDQALQSHLEDLKDEQD